METGATLSFRAYAHPPVSEPDKLICTMRQFPFWAKELQGLAAPTLLAEALPRIEHGGVIS
jgi:hypothetical protein